MTGPTRGRCLIINNNIFDTNSQLANRTGSHIDVVNIKSVFTDLSFICVVKSDLKSQVCRNN